MIHFRIEIQYLHFLLKYPKEYSQKELLFRDRGGLIPIVLIVRCHQEVKLAYQTYSESRDLY